MKRILIHSLIAASLLTLSSACEKYLDLKPISEKPDTDFLKSEENVRTVLIAAYDRLQSDDLFGGRLQRTNELYADNLDYGFVTGTDNRMFLSRNYDPFKNPGAGIWGSGYTAIYRSNVVIEAVDNNVFTASNDSKNRLKGEALLIRAICHFEICRMFSKPYANNPTADAGIPIRIKAYTPAEALVRVQRDPVGAVYTQVINDLKAAESLMSDDVYLGANRWAATAYLAKVYFDMNDFANAKIYADKVVNSGRFSLGTVGDLNAAWAPFQNRSITANNGGVIFQIFNQPGDDGSGGIRGVFWNQNTNSVSFTFWKDEPALNSLYRVLKAQPSLQRDSLLVDTTSTVSRTAYRKFSGPNLGTSQQPVNVCVVRLAEMLLIQAECAAQAGQLTDALNAMNQIAAINMMPNWTAPGSQQAMLDLIRDWRRVELFGENDRFHELRRLKKDIQNSEGQVFPWNTGKLMPIPLGEENGNPGIIRNDG